MLAFLSDTGIVVAVVAFVALFGASQIPKLARNLGEAGREFRKAHAELNTADSPVAVPTPAPEVSAADDRVTLSRDQFERLLAAGRPTEPADH